MDIADVDSAIQLGTIPMQPSATEPSSHPDPEEEESEETLVENHLEVANERKAEGNECFRAGKWNEALVAYRSALNCLPKRPTKPQDTPKPPTREEDGDEDDTAPAADMKPTESAEKEEKVVDVSSPGVAEADKEVSQLRAVLNANIGACFVKLGDHKEAVKACSEAILDSPTYVKALERRSSSNEIINSWTSLTSVQEDYNTLLKLVTSPSQLADIRRKLQHLKPRLEAAQKRETDEMLGKLKGLGNSILGAIFDLGTGIPACTHETDCGAGNFGLSTDNFKFEPNGAGGYSVNFSR
ncbi:hypothetical protein BDZ97DRAFT_1912219 [Flammula alnicola]|nr:hypothetical protein BDZ97DRAFT_1912219 [Flammula alnicola]